MYFYFIVLNALTELYISAPALPKKTLRVFLEKITSVLNL